MRDADDRGIFHPSTLETSKYMIEIIWQLPPVVHGSSDNSRHGDSPFHRARLPGASSMSKVFQFGERLPDYSVPVLNEREARAGAGILLLVTTVAFMNAWLTGDFSPTKIIVIGFFIDFFIRVLVARSSGRPDCDHPLGGRGSAPGNDTFRKRPRKPARSRSRRPAAIVVSGSR